MGRPAKTSERVQGPVFSEAPMPGELGFDDADALAADGLDEAPGSMLPVDDFDLSVGNSSNDKPAPTWDDSLAADENLPLGWSPIATAPCNRSIYLTSDPTSDAAGMLCFWRTTRYRDPDTRRWEPRSFWARLLNRQRIDFEPVAWKEANGIPIFQ